MPASQEQRQDRSESAFDAGAFERLPPKSTRLQGVRGWRTYAIELLILALIGTSGQPLLAVGVEVVNREADLVLSVDSRWPGNAFGGYFPLRIKLSNMGPPRDLTLVYEGRDNGREYRIPRVRRSVRVEQQATINFTLSIPVVSKGTDGVVRVYDSSGSEFEGLTSRHSLPDFGGHQPRTSLLVISTASLSDAVLQPFEDAAATEYAYVNGVWAYGSSGHSMSSAAYSNRFADMDHAVISPSSNLPVNWVDYSGLDLVAVAWSDWNSKLATTEREAILKWAAAGGLLMIYETGKPASQSEELNRTLQLERHATWTNCVAETHRSTVITPASEIRTAGYPSGHRGTAAAPVMPATPIGNSDPAEDVANRWKISNETFSFREWTLGRIYVLPDNPFPGTASDWAWWLSSIPKNQSQWPKKMGMSTRQVNHEFLNFLIPGVGSVPVYAFLTLITLFTVVIGPLNYYWLHKRRRVALMVFTVPIIAGVTCLLLFVYSLVSDGFSARTRVNSFTWLDQERKSAVSLSRICMYAPFAPSAGLTFSPECAVFPIWQPSAGFESGILDWSGNDQRMTGGWLRSQTWTQFQTIQYRDERGRLDFTPPSNPEAETITISNGLSWDLDYVTVMTAGGHWYAGEQVPAGATAQLKRKSTAEIGRHLNQAINDNSWAYPKGISVNSSSMIGYHKPYGRYGYEPDLATSFSQALMRRHLPSDDRIEAAPRIETLDWRDGRNAGQLQLHPATQAPHFWAVCRKNPSIQTGLKSSVDQSSLHVLFGTF